MMKTYRYILCGLLLALLGGNPPARAQTVGTCALGEAEADLDVNNVRARLYNAGNLFWRGQGNVYTVPKWGEAEALFTSGLWVGGYVNGELRFAGARFADYEYWPGPLDADGNPPPDCAAFDRIYRVSRADLERYEQTGQATDDLRAWPGHLGAPVKDGDGLADNYDLAGGDRPRLYGDQTAWWVMNDAGGVKTTPPMGLEVQGTAYAVQSSDALANTTFYRYRLLYKGRAPLENAYFGLWVDPDLGNAGDDFVGSDTLRQMGFVYNGADFDLGFDGYGDRPPALGYVILQGPLVDREGADNDRDGTIDETGERLGMTTFSCIRKGTLEARDAAGYYACLQGRWPDGTPLTVGGTGLGGTETTRYLFPAMPPAFWSEENVGTSDFINYPGDRRFVIGVGPFVMQPGDEQEIVFAIVWSQGLTRLHSVTQLREDADLAHAFFAGTYTPFVAPAPSAVPVPTAPAPEAVVEPDPERPAETPEVTFAWEPAGQGLYYRVQVAAAPSFDAPVIDHLTLSRDRTSLGTRQIGVDLEPDRRYYWRVRAENVSGAGPWSDVRTFALAASPVPARFALQGNYPNPFAGTTTLVFDLAVFAEVRVEVFDVLGRRVLLAADQLMSPGTGRTIRLDAAALPSGLYVYRINARATVDDRLQTAWQATGRMTVVQ